MAMRMNFLRSRGLGATTKRTKIVLSQELKNKEKKVVLNSVLMVNKESLLKEYDNTINNTFKYNN
jgi:hypothetical protein